MAGEDPMIRSRSGASPTLALILGLRTPFYLSIARGAQSAAEALGVTLLVDAPADFNASLQAAIVENVIARGVDAIIIAPCDDQEMIAPLQRAHAAGIAVITVDSVIGDGNYRDGAVTFPLAYIGSDNLDGGRLAGKAMIEAIGGQGQVYIQSTRPGLSATDQREQGFQEVIQATGGRVSLLEIGYDGGSIAQAAEQTAAILQRAPTLAGIFGTGDYSTKGVVQALNALGRSGSIKVVRFDSSEEAIADLRAGIVDVVIAQLPRDMGRIGVERAVAALQGKEQTTENYIPTGFVVIDRSNVDSAEAQEAIYRLA